MPRKAFTLIELLVVIAIISLIAAILLPVFASAREKARQSSCMNNCEQFSIAVTIYTGDWDDTYALNLYLLPNSNKTFSFLDAHLPYIKTSQPFLCPDDPRPINFSTFFQTCGYPFVSTGAVSALSYNGNYCIFEHGVPNALFGSGARPARLLAEVPSPALQTVMYDGTLDCAFDSPMLARHTSGLNVSYADGHAGYLHAQQVNGYWVPTEGPYKGLPQLWGLIDTNGNYAGCPT